MIRKTTKGYQVTSEKGKPLLQKDTGLTFREAYEREDGVRHEYEER